jgi:hypothetical protein
MLLCECHASPFSLDCSGSAPSTVGSLSVIRAVTAIFLKKNLVFMQGIGKNGRIASAVLFKHKSLHFLHSRPRNRGACFASTFEDQWLLYVPPDFTTRNVTLYSQDIFMGFIWVPQQNEILCLHKIKPLVLVMMNECLLRGTNWYFKCN